MAQAPAQAAGNGNMFTRMFQGFNNSGNQQPQNQQQQNQPQNQNMQTQDPANGSIDPNNPQAQKNPFDVYAKLFDNTLNPDDTPPQFRIDDKLIDEASSRMDFAKDMPEDLQAIMQEMGEQGQKLLPLMNYFARKAYGSSLNHSAQLTDKYLGIRDGHVDKRLQRAIKEQLAFTGINANQAAKNPVIRDHLKMVAKNLAAQNPDATPEWLQEHTLKYFTEVANALNPQQNQEQMQQEQKKSPGGEEFPWDEWLKKY